MNREKQTLDIHLYASASTHYHLIKGKNLGRYSNYKQDQMNLKLYYVILKGIENKLMERLSLHSVNSEYGEDIVEGTRNLF